MFTTLRIRQARTTLLLCSLFIGAFANAAIRGTIIDERGAAIAQATVRAYPQETARERASRVVAGKVEREPLASASTGDDGSFSLDVSAPVVEFVATAPGRIVHAMDVAGSDDIGPLILQKQKPLTGRVTAGGKPVAGAIVIDGPMIVRTANDGTFARTRPRVTVYHPDYAVADSTSSGPDQVLEVQLTAGTTIRGRVVSPDGKAPVAHAKVSTGPYAQAESGEDGTFVINHAPTQWRVIRAISESGGAAATRSSATTYELRLRPLGTIEGTVREAKTRVPVSGMRLTLRDQGVESVAAITDAKGTFSFGTLLPAHYALTASHPLMEFEGEAGITVVTGEKQSRNYAAVPLTRVTGTVVDESKKPLAAAWIGIAASQADSSRATATNAKGEFSIRMALPASPQQRPYSGFVSTFIAVRHEGYLSAFENVADSAGKPLVITLRRGVPLEVKVVDAERKPIAKVNASFGSADENEGSRINFSCDEGPCITDADGKFTVRAVPGNARVWLSGPIVPKIVPSIRIEEKPAPLTFVAERGVMVTGQVVYSDGSPAPDTGVILTAAPSVSIPAQTDASGFFRFANSPRGQVTLAIRAEGQMATDAGALKQTVNAPAEGVVLKMPPTGRISGTVTDSTTRRPITDFQISAGGGVRYVRPSSFSSSDGKFTLDHVPAGRVDLVVSAVGYVRGALNGVEVVDTKATPDVEIRLDAAGKVTGRVTSRSGDPLSGVFVSVVQGGGRFMGVTDAASTDSNGEFKLESVPPGDQRIAFVKQGFLRQEKIVAAGPGKESRVDLVLEPGLELRGRVVDESGQAVATAQIQVQAPGDGGNTRSDSSGMFTLSGLRDIHYSLVARKSGYVDARIDDVVPGTSAPLTLTMRRGGTVTGHVTGIPAGSTFINVSVAGDRTYLNGRVDASTGTFTISGVPDGNFTAEAMASGAAGTSPRRSSRVSVVVANGTASPVELAFSEGLTMRGRVTLQGKPATGYAIVFNPSTQAGSQGAATVGLDGGYTVEGLAAGDYRVRVMMRGSSVYEEPYTVTASGIYDVDIRAASVRGRVTDADSGAPIGNASVSFSNLDRKPFYIQSVSTDFDGNYFVDAVVEGKWRLLVQRDGYRAETREVTVLGATTADVQMSAGTKLTVVLVDASDGRPINGSVTAFATSKKTPAGSGSTRGDGIAEIWLAPGTYIVSAGVGQYFADSVTVNVPGPDVRIAMHRAGRVVVRWTRTTGVTSVGLRSVASAVSGGVVSGGRQSGSGAFENVRPGQYVAQLLGADGKPVAEQPVTVAGGQTATVVFP